MIIDILKNNEFIQANTGDNKGTIWASKNIDPQINKGKLNISKTLGYVTNTDDQANLEAPAAGFAFNSVDTDRYFAVADDRVWYTANANPNSAWSEIPSTPTDVSNKSDIIAFNSKIYIATANKLKSHTQGAGFSDVGNLDAFPHSFTIYANRLYVSSAGQKVYSMDTAETLVTTGSNTIDLGTTTGYEQVITKINAVTDGIWIATTYTDKAGGQMVKWDGETANVATSKYELSRGVLAMIIKDDRPYIVDSAGIMRVFDGTTFVEIGQFPLYDEELDNFNSNANDRWIHPNGMIIVGEEIYMLVSNTRYDSNYDVIERMPSGIWAWNKDFGLYHKYSFAQVDLASATVSDYGANNLAQVGALFNSNATGNSNSITRPNQSEVLAGIKYYTDATSTKGAIGITDVTNIIQKAGYFVTAQIGAEQVAEQWQKVIALYDKFKNSTDKIIIKYRTSEDDPVYGTGTWSEDDILRSTDDLSTVSGGDEVEILQGKGAGLCTHIKSITGNYRMTLDETISGMSGTCKFRVQKWKKVGEIADQEGSFTSLGFDSNASSWIQFKIFIIGTGRSPQISRIVSKSEPSEDY
jgi:hypothetical protein